jgi:hypothetical protein
MRATIRSNDPAQRALVAQALDLEPEDLSRHAQAGDLVDRHLQAFEHAGAVVADHLEARRAGREDDRPRRGTDRWAAALPFAVRSVRSSLARGHASRLADPSLARPRVTPSRRPR